MAKIFLLESQFEKLLNEVDYNYHFTRGGDDEHTMEPYVSDSKYVMDGRGTGHFGSGTYFSTYKEESPSTDKEYGLNNPNQNGEFIKIGKNVYRVDLDLYKNLYRVQSQRQGDVLYSLLRYLNQMFCRITSFGKFNKENARYNNADLYQRIQRNADALNLKCPSYYQLTRMMQEHGQNDKRQSFSTVFMEYNGFNGVNVSGIPIYDNTMHGSVIYDLSKLGDDTIQQINPKSLWDVSGSYQNTTVAKQDKDELFDTELLALDGKTSFWLANIKSMPRQRALRHLKNYVESNAPQLTKYDIKNLESYQQKAYLRMLFHKNKDGIEVSKLAPTIAENNAYYWVNYIDEYHKRSGLIDLLHYFDYQLDWENSNEENLKLNREEYNRLSQYLYRELTDFEMQWLKNNEYIS